MTLDDFFTLTEMNNGLNAPSRVREVVAVMVNERDSTLKNVGDATRQWSAVATAIAATENKTCLDLFIQLDGLHFIDKWLKDAQKFSNDTSDSFVEESMTHLLQALEKLHVDKEKFLSSDIWTTVKDLLLHNSSKVQDKARVLFESWETQRDGHASIPDVEKVGALTDDGMGKSVNIEKDIGSSEYCLRDTSLSSETSGKEKVQESIRDDPVQSTSSDALHPGPVESEPNLNRILDPPVVDDRPLDHISSSSFSNPAMETPVHPAIGTTSAKFCCPDVSRHDILDGLSKCHELESTSDMNDKPKIENSPQKLGSVEESKMSEEIPFPSSSDAADAMNSITEHTSLKVSVSGDKNFCGEGSSCIDSKTNDSDGKGAMSDSGYLNQRRSSSAFSTKEGGEFYHRVLWSSSSSEKRWENPKDARKVLSQIKDGGKINKLDLHVRDDGLAIDYNIAKKEMDREHDLSGKKSDVDLDYGIVDPLEVARQVAIEVEREVVDYREQSCSSEKLPEGNIWRPDSPDSVSANKSHTSDGSPKDAANDPDLSAEASSMQEESATSSEDPDAEQTNGTRDVEISQVTEASQEETNQEKGTCNFDLNIDVCSEDADRCGNQFSTPVSVVSASRAAAAPGLPVAPLRFEGNLGWKGSAATSAFRPASPRRMPENDKDLSTGGSSISSKQRQGLLDIDLNVAESGDGRIGDLSADKQVPASSSLPSGESSVEMNSRSEHLELDLNLASEDGDMPTNWQTGQLFPHRNVYHSRSNSSSSSSKQPSLKNIDLNDQPSFPNDSFENSYLSKLSHNFNISGGIKSDDSVISIMGTRVEVTRKDSAAQTVPFSNGQISELAFDVNLGRTGSFLGIGSVFPYAHSSVYGYNNIAPAPALPFSSTIYGSGGPIPYMVDSRGAPVVPQIVGPASALPTAFAQPPFAVNMSRSTPSNGVGSSRSSFDLNSGTVMEGGNRDPTGLGLFLNSGQVRSMDEHLRSNSQAAIGSGIGGKRKEPDNGWEHYPLKPYPPPWI